MRILITISILILLTSACEEAFDKDLNNNEEVRLVVDARMTSERKPQEVRLSLTFNDLNDEPPPVTDAFVVINDGTTNHFLAHDNNRPGVYVSDTLQALFGKFYTLYIVYQTREYFAFATSAVGTPLPPLAFQEVETGIFEFIDTETIPSITEVVARWTETNESGQVVERSKEAFFYTLDVIDVNKTFAPDREPFLFPRGATIHRKKFSMTTDHQNFIRSFLSEVDWRGGGFDVAAGNVLTNITGGAVGYFSVSMVATDSTRVE